MFGPFELKTQFIKIGGKRIHLLEEAGGFVRYRRDDVERLIKKADGENLLVVPTPAIGYGVKLLMILLREPLAVPPGERVEGFLEAPVDVEVRTGSLVIDRFVPCREKYALYGSVERGAIARYQVSSFTSDEPDSLGVLKVSVENPSDEWKGLDKVVLPLDGTPMYYSTDRAYYPLIRILLRNGGPEVNNTGEPPREDLRSSGPRRALPKFLVRW
ncbi:DUF432 domain-containing protein [Thermococcus sp.]